MNYIIDYHTGAGNMSIDSDDLDTVKALADSNAAYTQQPITIVDEDNNEIVRREWYGVKDGWEDCENPIQFGSFGYYDDWHDINN